MFIAICIAVSIFATLRFVDAVDETAPLSEGLVQDLYEVYKEAMQNGLDGKLESRRTIQKKDKYFNVHIRKLKEVNGVKNHNLLIQEYNDNTSLIYINNPVESRIPRAFLSLEEFKAELESRALRMRAPNFTGKLTAIDFKILKKKSHEEHNKEDHDYVTKKQKFAKELPPNATINVSVNVTSNTTVESSIDNHVILTTTTVADVYEDIYVSTTKRNKHKVKKPKRYTTKNSVIISILNTSTPENIKGNATKALDEKDTTINQDINVISKAKVDKVDTTINQDISVPGDTTKTDTMGTSKATTVVDLSQTKTTIREDSVSSEEITYTDATTNNTTSKRVTAESSEREESKDDETTETTKVSEESEKSKDDETSEMTKVSEESEESEDEVSTETTKAPENLSIRPIWMRTRPKLLRKTTVTTTKTKRRTLGRPLVFMGAAQQEKKKKTEEQKESEKEERSE